MLQVFNELILLIKNWWF